MQEAAYGYWRPLLSCSSLPTKVDYMVQTFIYSAVMYGAEVWDEGGQTDVSGRKETPAAF
jgi:hypothetical protein